MSLPSLPFEQVKKMKAAARTEYFEEYARYFEQPGQPYYSLRIGSKTLTSTDTKGLRLQFDRWLKRAVTKRTGPTPLELRILKALDELSLPGLRADYYAVMYKVWPPSKYPRAYRSSSNGGPPGVARIFGHTLDQMRMAGLIQRMPRLLGGLEERFGQHDILLTNKGRKTLKA